MADNLPRLPHCPDCGYTEQDESINMDHYLCEARGGVIPRIRWQDHVELQRRVDAVRALCAEMPRRMHANTSQESARFRGACDFATEVLALLSGDGEAGDE